MDRIDIHNHINLWEKRKLIIASDKSILPENRETILQYHREASLGKTIKKGQKKKIGPGRNIRTAGILVFLDKYFKKPFIDITVKDMENFILGLEEGAIKVERGKNKGMPYSSESQKTIKKFIRKFWKWLKGNSQIYPEEVDWIDTSGKDADIKAITRLDVDLMVEHASGIMHKALILVTFDSGAREGEILNVRLKDVEPLGPGHDVLVIRIRHSKTFGRPISLPISTNLLKGWLSSHPEKDNPDAALFPLVKNSFYNCIKKCGKSALNKNVTPQMLRHTSATFYSTKLDRASFCKRFGWSYASRMPDRYIDWAKVMEKKTTKIIQDDELIIQKKRIKSLEEQIILLKESNEKIKNILFEKLKPELKDKGIL